MPLTQDIGNKSKISENQNHGYTHGYTHRYIPHGRTSYRCASLTGIHLTGVRLVGVHLIGAYISQGMYLRDVHLMDVHLMNVAPSWASFAGLFRGHASASAQSLCPLPQPQSLASSSPTPKPPSLAPEVSRTSSPPSTHILWPQLYCTVTQEHRRGIA